MKFFGTVNLKDAVLQILISALLRCYSLWPAFLLRNQTWQRNPGRKLWALVSNQRWCPFLILSLCICVCHAHRKSNLNLRNINATGAKLGLVRDGHMWRLHSVSNFVHTFFSHTFLFCISSHHSNECKGYNTTIPLMTYDRGNSSQSSGISDNSRWRTTSFAHISFEIHEELVERSKGGNSSKLTE